jgi:hypothetical protein
MSCWPKAPQLEVRSGSLGKAGQIDIKKQGRKDNIGGIGQE